MQQFHQLRALRLLRISARALVAIAVGGGVSALFRAADHLLLAEFIGQPSFAGKEPLLAFPASGIAVFLLNFALTMAATWAGFKLMGAARIVVTAQILILAIVVHLLLWNFLGVESSPLWFFASIVFGSLLGLNLHEFDVDRRGFESREVELTIRNRELADTQLVMHLRNEMERGRLAAELHDQILPEIGELMETFAAYQDGKDKKAASDFKKMLRQTMDHIREVMDDLSPGVLELFGLAAAIEDCLDRGAKKAGFEVRFNNQLGDADLKSLSDLEQSILYRVVQEAVKNACLHAGASIVQAKLSKDDEQIVVLLTDNGKGMPPNNGEARSTGLGLRYMELRAAMIGARVRWNSGEKSNGQSKGTEVEIRVNRTTLRM
jgi:signal transduction histidine kinase